MVERVARASFACWRENATRSGVHLDQGRTFEDLLEGGRSFAIHHARAVIAAMREPDDEMIQAAADLWLRSDDCPPGEASWRVMIDEALK